MIWGCVNSVVSTGEEDITDFADGHYGDVIAPPKRRKRYCDGWGVWAIILACVVLFIWALIGEKDVSNTKSGHQRFGHSAEETP